MTDRPDPGDRVAGGVGGAAAALSRYLVARATLGETLRWVAELAVVEVPSADAVGLTLLEARRKPVTVFATQATISTAVDQAQYDEDQGPCLEAFRSRQVVRVGDVATVATRWPGYARAAAAAGVRSTLSVPLVAADDVYGAMNLYARQLFAFSDADVTSTQVLVDQAAVVLANASAYWDARDLATGLGEAMRSRAVIEQAKVKLMASGRYDADQAFDVLVKASQRTGVRLRDLAERIVNDQPLPQARPEARARHHRDRPTPGD